MENKLQCPHGLIYNSFGIIQMQTFCTDHLQVNVDNTFVRIFDDPIDRQIFTQDLRFYKRYELKGFDIKIEIDDEENSILEGHVHVRAIMFFDNCMQLSYRFVVADEGKLAVEESNGEKEFCRINHPFNTDQLIIAAGISQKVEHWDVDKNTGKQTIDGVIKKVTITGLHLDKDSVFYKSHCDDTVTSLDEVMLRYRYYFDKSPASERIPCLHHTFIDICENIDHTGGSNFDDISEAAIIEHIETHHKAELIGIMTLYPKEWPYRMDDSYEDVCGKNIAIDTDDLVLTNQNMTLVIGTYGRRGGEEGGVNWIEHLKRRDAYHVCWPEYKTLIELILAKKQTINYAITRYVQKSALISDSSQNAREMIEANAKLSIQISNIVVQLDPMRYLRYMSHKYMFKVAENNMNVPNDEKYLNEVISKIDNSLNNANNSMELKHAHNTNRILLIISLASLFGVLLQGHHVPILTRLFHGYDIPGVIFAVILCAITLIIILWVIYILIRYYRKSKKKNDKRI